MKEKKSIVVIGGGTGTHPVLQGLKKYKDDIFITAVISMADSGGSTGRLRDEFGQLPVGDVRMALTALASDVDEHDHLLRELFLHRFDKGEGLNGHNFGNLLIVALTEILGSEEEAVKAAARILRIRGRVLPVTADKVDIVAEYDDGVVVKGEHDIDEPPEERYEHHIEKFTTEPKGVITDDAREAILNADLVLLGPGDLYASLFANCVIGGVSAAILQSNAKFVFAANLMTRPGQTHGMTVADHVSEVEKYVGKIPDVVVVNTGEVPEHLLTKYADAFQFPVVDDADKLDCEVIRAELLSTEEVIKRKGDVLQRSLVRGDGEKFAKLLVELVQS
ncbi:MAG: putative cofD-like protein [Acidimicrobiales bacterium]|jgi:uncharacterized cofD-like protein